MEGGRARGRSIIGDISVCKASDSLTELPIVR